MLKKPYIKINTVEDNNYYLLFIGNDEVYLATETVYRYDMRLLGFTIHKELTQGLKLLPLRSFIIQLLLEVKALEYLGTEEKPWGLEAEDRFEILNTENVKQKLATIYDEMCNTLQIPEKERTVKYRAVTQNEALKAFINEGNSILAVEELGAITRKVWFANTNKLGNLIIHIVLLTGKAGKDSIVSVSTFVFDRDTIEKTLEYLQQDVDFIQSESEQNESEQNESKESKEENKND